MAVQPDHGVQTSQRTPRADAHRGKRFQIERPPRLIVAAAPWAAGLLVLGLVLVTGTGLITSMYALEPADAALASLGEYASRGVFYPPVDDGQHAAGTRYAPLGIALMGIAGVFIDNPVAPGKLISLLSAVGLWATISAAAARFRCPLWLAFLLPALIFLSDPGWKAVAGVRHDALAAMFQIAAILATTFIAARPRIAVAAAAALAATAVLAKLSAVWAGAAIFLWLCIHHRRQLPVFLVTGVGVGLTGFGLTALASEGRFIDNLTSFLMTENVHTPISSAESVARALFGGSFTASVVAAAGLAAAAWGLVARRAPVWAIAAALVSLYAVYLFTKAGISWNHIIEAYAAYALAIGAAVGALRQPLAAARDTAPGPEPDPTLRQIAVFARLAAAVAVVAACVGTREGRVATSTAVRGARFLASGTHADDRFAAEALLARLPAEGPVLTDVPVVNWLRNETPPVLDPFMLRRMPEDRRAEVEARIVQGFNDRAFAALVVYDIDATRASEWGWTPAIVKAMEENYDFAAPVEQFAWYRSQPPINMYLPRKDAPGPAADTPMPDAPSAIAPLADASAPSDP